MYPKRSAAVLRSARSTGYRLPGSVAVAMVVLTATAANPAEACPFCTALVPTLAQRREAATVAALAELTTEGHAERTFRLHHLLAGADRLPQRHSVTVPSPASPANPLAPPGPDQQKPGALALLLATRDADSPPERLKWEIVPLSEIAYAYVLRAPPDRLPAAERLAYFARYLEHRDSLVAQDAYLEFGHAPLDVVEQVADRLPMDAMRRWIVDPRVPEQRKGFYGLALGLAKQPADRAANLALLRRLATEPADDFRAGYDGILAGYLRLDGTGALEQIEARILANADARPGDLQHALAALRFEHEFGGGAIPDARLREAMRLVLKQPQFAAAAIVDLARWRDWDSLDAVVALFNHPGDAAGATSRAVVGYLLACPEPRAQAALARLRAADPRTVEEAERQLSVLGTSR